jgi:LysR family hydrogen peroxide-inducible transcriptional activator
LTLTLLEGLNDGTFDALLTPMPISGMDMTAVPLYREPLLVALPADHPLAHKEAIERADLKAETVLALEPGHRLYEQVRELCAQVGANISLDFGGTSLDTLRLMVGMGMGIALLPALYVRSEIPKDQDVVVRPLRNRPLSRVIGMTWRQQSARAAEFSILADLFQRILSEKVPEVMPMR